MKVKSKRKRKVAKDKSVVSSQKKAEDLMDKIRDSLIQYMEDNNCLLWERPWFNGGIVWPCNAGSGKKYRGVNCWWAKVYEVINGYSSSLYVTLNQVKSTAGATFKGFRRIELEEKTVKYGDDAGSRVPNARFEAIDETSVWPEPLEVLTFIPRPVLKLEEEDENGDKVEKIVRRKPLMKVHRVYNLDCIEGFTPTKKVREMVEKAAKEDNQREEFNPIQACEDLLEGYVDKPKVVHKGVQCVYYPVHDIIHMASKKRFASEELYYSVLFHEHIHGTGHSSRCKRGLDTKMSPFGSTDYSFEELIAEFGAAFLCGIAGLEAPKRLENSAVYMKGWLSKLKSQDSKDWLIKAATKAQTAVDYIMGVKYEEKE